MKNIKVTNCIMMSFIYSNERNVPPRNKKIHVNIIHSADTSLTSTMDLLIASTLIQDNTSPTNITNILCFIINTLQVLECHKPSNLIKAGNIYYPHTDNYREIHM